MPELDLTEALGVRFGNVDVSAVRMANQNIWEASTADGPYYVNDALGIVPGAFSDGTPNIATGHLVFFHNPGYVTGFVFYDGTASGAGWSVSLWSVTTLNGITPNSPSAVRLGTKTVSPTGSGERQINFDTPIAVDAAEMYLISRYSSDGRYVHNVPAFTGSHGAYTDADPVYLPGDGENVSSLVPTWTGCARSIYRIGEGDICPFVQGDNGPYYGITPIFFKSL